LIHIIESENVYYNSVDRKYYFKNEYSRYDYPFLDVLDNVEMVDDILFENCFSLIKKRKSRTYAIINEDNLSLKCLYFGSFIEYNCYDLSVDLEYTSCKVISSFIRKRKNNYHVNFAALISSRNFMCFKIISNSGDRFRVVYAYNPLLKAILKQSVRFKEWDELVNKTLLDDYEDSFDTEVNFDLLDRIKDTGFVFKKFS